MEEGGYGSAIHLHRALGAKFLTAKATDAIAAVDLGFALLYDDGVRGANVTANATSDTKIFFELRPRGEHAPCQLAEEAFEGIFAVPREAERAAFGHAFEIGEQEPIQRAVERDIFHGAGEQASPLRRFERRKFTY